MKRGRRFLAALLAAATFLAVFYTEPAQVEAESQDQTMAFRTDDDHRDENLLIEALQRSDTTAIEPLREIEGREGTVEEWLEDFEDTAGTAAKSASDLGIEKVDQLAEQVGLNNIFGKAIGICGNTLNIANDIIEIADPQNEEGPARSLERFLLVADIMVALAQIIGVFVAFPPMWSLLLPVIAVLLAFLLWFVRSNFFNRWLENDRNRGGTFSKILDTVFFWTKCPSNVNVYKPNIYIYADDQTEVTVTFDDPDLLTATIPDYTGTWKVRTGADGKLYSSDGEAYDFLFYESESDRSLFQTEEGFVIRADERKEEFERILAQYGFNEKEIHDFTEFWCEKLDQDADYMMYPQGTETVDAAMPVQITPEPESIVRMWFAFEKCSEENTANVLTAQITPFDRAGYALVEWGGLVLDE